MNIFYSLIMFSITGLAFTYINICNLLFITIYEDNSNEYHYYNEDNNCPICYENKINSCCIPCGHTYCDKCIKNTNNCFICRRNISKNIKIFI